jgi:hypothetical protein
MSSINFLPSGAAAATAQSAACKRTAPSAFEVNTAMYGPVAASAIGVAQAAAPAASSVVSFSQAALKELASAADSVSDTVGDAVDFVGEGLSSVAGAAVAAYDQGVKLAHSVENAADAVGDVVGSATGAVTDGLMTAASNVAGYALLGAAGLAGLIDDVV